MKTPIAFIRTMLWCVLAAGIALAQDEVKQENKSLLRRLAEMRMALPEELKSDVTELKGTSVRTPRRPLQYPPYRVTKLKRSTIRGGGFTTSSGRLAVSKVRARQTFAFTLVDNRTELWWANCGWTRNAEDVTYDESEREQWATRTAEGTAIECELTPPAGGKPWQLVLNTFVAPRLVSARVRSSGWLTDGVTRYEVAATYELEGLKVQGTTPAGYIFSSPDAPVAAVETSHAGRLIFRNRLAPEQRALFAAASSALALQIEEASADDF